MPIAMASKSSPRAFLKAALAAAADFLALAVAVLIEALGGHRGLTAEEKEVARKVFGASIDLSRVKVAVSSWPANLANRLNGGRPFTTMYVINFATGAPIAMGTLVHELTHAWQAKVCGPRYMRECLLSQAFGRGYEVTEADIAAAGGDIRKLEPEQQAVVVQRYYDGKWGGGPWDPAVYEPLARCVFQPGPEEGATSWPP